MRAQHPAHPVTADEAEEGDSPVCDQPGGNRVPRGQQGLTPALRQTGFTQKFNKAECRQGRVFGRFDDHRAATGNGRTHLVYDQVQGVIESAESHHDTNGFSACKRQAVGGSGIQLHGDFRAMAGTYAFDAVLYAIDSAQDLHSRVHQRLAAFTGCERDQLIKMLLHQAGGLFQDTDASGSRQPLSAVVKSSKGTFQRLPDAVFINHIHRCQQTAVIGRSNRERLTSGDCTWNSQRNMRIHEQSISLRWGKPVCRVFR